MAAFTEIDWQRIDGWAIVQNGGLATIEPERHDTCRQWLLRDGFNFDIPEGGGHVLELIDLDVLWQQEPEQEKTR